MDKFNRKYRNESTRLQNWDYGWAAAYFITICTKDRECFFGEVWDGLMELSPVGAIANVLWYEIKNHSDYVELGEFVVMPNHVHGIILLNENSPDATKNVGATGSYKSAVTKHCNKLGFVFAWQPRFHDHIIRDDTSFERITKYIQNNPSNWRGDTFHPDNPN